MTRTRKIVGWSLIAGYAFLALAGHAGLHALSGDEHAHCHAPAGGGHEAHVHTAATESHSGHSHSHPCRHSHPHGADPAGTAGDEPPQPLPGEHHHHDCLICVVLSSPLQVTAAVAFAPLDHRVGEEQLSNAAVPDGPRLPLPPVRGPPAA